MNGATVEITGQTQHFALTAEFARPQYIEGFLESPSGRQIAAQEAIAGL